MGKSANKKFYHDRSTAAKAAMLVGLLACSLFAWAVVGWVVHWLMTL